MRRALVAIALTVAGLVPLLRYHPDVASTSGAVAATAVPGASGSPGSASAGSPGPSGVSGGDTVDGSVAETDFGPYQVQAVFQGTRLTDVRMVLTPRDRRSRSIAQDAEPTLREEALQAQSAKIDTVSGATATSEGYAQSLQAAIDAHAQGR
jgi:uncharacterized protein with FMN-binding domain